MSTYTGSIYATVILYCFSMSRLIASCDEVSRLIEAGKTSQSQSASATIQQWDIVRIKYIYTYIFKFGSLSSATCRRLNVTAFGHFVNSSEIFINFVFKLQHTHTIQHTLTHTQAHTQVPVCSHRMANQLKISLLFNANKLHAIHHRLPKNQQQLRR